MNSFIGNGFAAFGYAGQGEAVIHSGPITCWQATNAHGQEGLLWRIRLDRAAVEADRERDPVRWGRAGGAPEAPELQRALWGAVAGEIQQQMDAAARFAAANPGVMLAPLHSELRDYLMDASVKELFILTETARPLRQALAAGMADEADVLELCAGVCARLRLAGGSGLAYGALSADAVLLDEEGTPRLMPWWPLAAAAQPEGFAPGDDTDPEQRQVYSVGMLAYWLLNRGSLPFAEDAACAADAEARRVRGERLPAAQNASAQTMSLIDEVCEMQGSDWTAEELQEAFREILEPEQTAREAQKRQQEQDEADRAEAREERRQKEEEDLRRAEKEEARRRRQAAADPGTDAKDRRLLLGGVALVLVLVIGAGLFMAGSRGRKVRGKLDSGSYAAALQQLEQYHADGQNVDELVDEVVDRCLAEGEYVRAMAAFDYYAADTVPDPGRTGELVQCTVSSGDAGRAVRFLEKLAGRSEECAQLAQQLCTQYLEEES
ncbi:MAG: hypothetical protein IJ484_02325 [Oscillospiraceae bacterium]|nr:hypothetical protein [Oscillospiraceae bacterium]